MFKYMTPSVDQVFNPNNPTSISCLEDSLSRPALRLGRKFAADFQPQVLESWGQAGTMLPALHPPDQSVRKH